MAYRENDINNLKSNTKTESKQPKEEKSTETKGKMTDSEKQLRQKYQDKLLKETKREKGMGVLFWVLLGLCIAMIVFMVTVIIVRNK